MRPKTLTVLLIVLMVMAAATVATLYLNAPERREGRLGKCLFAGKRYFDLPIVTGIKTPDDPQLHSVIRLLCLLKKEKGVLSLKDISEVHLDEDLGLTVFTLNGQEILLGKNAFSDKLKTLRKVFVYLQKKHLSVKRIDLTEPNRVYAKLAH